MCLLNCYQLIVFEMLKSLIKKNKPLIRCLRLKIVIIRPKVEWFLPHSQIILCRLKCWLFVHDVVWGSYSSFVNFIIFQRVHHWALLTMMYNLLTFYYIADVVLTRIECSANWNHCVPVLCLTLSAGLSRIKVLTIEAFHLLNDNTIVRDSCTNL